MSQYSSRIHIRVTSPDIWNRFKNADDGDFGLARLSNTGSVSFVPFEECCYTEYELDSLVQSLSKTLAQDGIIIADTTNINVDPYSYCVFYLGADVNTFFFGFDKYDKRYNMALGAASISNFAEWLNFGCFELSDKEKEHLMLFGITHYIDNSKTVYEEFSYDLDIEERIILRETGLDGRPDAIENISLLDDVRLCCAKSGTDNIHLIEAFCNDKSIGYLPSDAADALYPLLASNRLNYAAKIVKVIPLSKRNKHAVSPIVEIHIEACASSVPDFDENADFWQNFILANEYKIDNHSKSLPQTNIPDNELIGSENENWQQYMAGIL